MSDPTPPACSLAEKDCIPCRGGVPPLAGEALARLADELANDWQVIDGHHIAKTYTFKDFADALAFTNKVGELAETIGHHPDLHLSWGKVQVVLWTHKIGGLAEADFIFAAKTDQLL